MILAVEVSAHPLFGILTLIGFLLVFTNLGYRTIQKRRKHVQLLRLLFPDDIEENFMWTNGAFTHLDFDVFLWLNAPFYFEKIAEDKLTTEVLEAENQVRIASRKLMVAFGYFFGYFLVFAVAASFLR